MLRCTVQSYACDCVDLSVELAVCSLLLGDSEKAEDILALGPDSNPDQADPAIKSFVMVCPCTAYTGSVLCVNYPC